MCRAIAIVALLSCLGGATIAEAQTAQLAGLVRDSTGAAIVGASLTLENEATGTSRAVKSNDAGLYAFPLLVPGSYRLTIDATSFKRLTRQGLELTVGQNARLDITLDVAAVTESVSVKASTPLVDATTTSVGTTIDRHLVENLPLSGRTFQSLIALSPGVVLTNASSRTGQFSVNGQRSTANYLMIDGVSANVGAEVRNPGASQESSGSLPGFGATGGTNNMISMDAFREVTVLTSTFAPEYGRTPGAQISIVTRSGTNQPTGSAFEYFRTNSLDATDWFINNQGAPRPDTRYHNFGGVFGGPLHRDSTFFFASYEAQRLNVPRFRLTEVPSDASRAAAPASIAPLLSAFPVANGAVTTAGLAQFGSLYANPSNLDSASVRVDHQLGSRHLLFGRYSGSSSDNALRGGRTPSSGLPLSIVEYNDVSTHQATAGLTSTLTGSLVNDLRVNYSRYRGDDYASMDDFAGAQSMPINLFLPPYVDPSRVEMRVFLHGGVGGYYYVGDFGSGTQRQINIVDTLAWDFGAHHLKSGVDYRRLAPVQSPPDYQLIYRFNNITNALAGTLPSISIRRTVGAKPIFVNFSAFAQDTWNLTHRLTLTYGTRYEVNPPPHSGDGREPLLVTGIEDPSSIHALPTGSALWSTSWGNFAPRAGLSYLARDSGNLQLVMRGGYGIFYDIGVGPAGIAFGGSFPFLAQRAYTTQKYPDALSTIQPPDLSASVPGASTVFSFPNNLKLPMTHQWNATIEASLGASNAVTVSYVGAAGRRLLYRQSSIQAAANPSFQLVSTVSNDATSDYNALQLQYRRRLGHGFQGMASYVWAHALDIASDDFAEQPPIGRINANVNRGNAAFDVRHAFNGAFSWQIAPSRQSTGWAALLDGWQTDVIWSARTGAPIEVYSLRDLGFGLFSFRPDLVADTPLYLDDPAVPGGRRINKAAFVTPTTLRQGTLGRNVLRGPNFWQLDLAVSKRIRLSPVNLRLRVEAFNVFNHPNFSPYVGLLSSSLFGTSNTMFSDSLGSGDLSSGGLNPLYQSGGPRALQLSCRVDF